MPKHKNPIRPGEKKSRLKNPRKNEPRPRQKVKTHSAGERLEYPGRSRDAKDDNRVKDFGKGGATLLGGVEYRESVVKEKGAIKTWKELEEHLNDRFVMERNPTQEEIDKRIIKKEISLRVDSTGRKCVVLHGKKYIWNSMLGWIEDQTPNANRGPFYTTVDEIVKEYLSKPARPMPNYPPFQPAANQTHADWEKKIREMMDRAEASYDYQQYAKVRNKHKMFVEEVRSMINKINLELCNLVSYITRHDTKEAGSEENEKDRPNNENY